MRGPFDLQAFMIGVAFGFALGCLIIFVSVYP